MPKNLTGVELIAYERARQIEKEGWTALHDDEHEEFQLSQAAVCYADTAILVGRRKLRFIPTCYIHNRWPWAPFWFKPTTDIIRMLVKAGALIAAEIDRLQRKAERESNKV